MCKSICQTHEPKQVPTDAAEELEKECEDLVVANEGPRRASTRRVVDSDQGAK